jgi:hypothetical protein
MPKKYLNDEIDEAVIRIVRRALVNALGPDAYGPLRQNRPPPPPAPVNQAPALALPNFNGLGAEFAPSLGFGFAHGLDAFGLDNGLGFGLDNGFGLGLNNGFGIDGFSHCF